MLNPKKLVGFSPRASLTPLKIAAGSSFTARATFRWFPIPLAATYAAMHYIAKRHDVIVFPPEIMPPNPSDSTSLSDLPRVSQADDPI